MIRRRMELKNTTGSPLYLREHQHAAVIGRYSHEVLVDPGDVVKNFPATFYQNRCRDSLGPAEIVIFVEVEESLTPETFVRYGKLIFELDREDVNNLLVYGIPSRFTDFGCLLGLRILGGDYNRRSRILILESRIKQGGIEELHRLCLVYPRYHRYDIAPMHQGIQLEPLLILKNSSILALDETKGCTY